MAKAVFLNGHLDNMKFIELDENEREATKTILDILEIENKNLQIFTFGYKYIMMWQNAREEKTSAEITVSAGVSYPYFIDSKVVIYKFESEVVDFEEISTLVDVDMGELKKHFNMENAFWALKRMQVIEPVVKRELTEDEMFAKMEMEPSEDDD